jgi:hypothetical protein
MKKNYDKDNLKDLVVRETVFATALAPTGQIGIGLGVAGGYSQAVYNDKKRRREYKDEQNDIGFAVNEGMNELEEF